MVQFSSASLMKAVFALSAFDFFSTASATTKNTTNAPSYDCHAGQSCWPSIKEWEILNSTLSGNLHRTVPYAASCYYDSPHFDVSVCREVTLNSTLNQARTEVYGSASGLNWEGCLTKSCGINPLNADVLSNTCDLGRLSALYVDAREPKHVASAVTFARKHNIRVSIKNTGHDYFGRSTSPNTLAIWTHNMNKMSYHETFTASNCSASNGQYIGEIGAGAQASDIYAYFEKHNMDVTGGNEGSVGLAGGFGQGGGHGVFGPSHGLMVDNAVEFDVVTADGHLRTINQCNDPELFWAMRGGGGGAFAVLTSYRFQLHPAVKINVFYFNASFTEQGTSNATGNNYAVLKEILTKHATYQPEWSHNNVSGHAYYWPHKAEIILVLPSNNETALSNLTSEFASFLNKHKDIQVYDSHYITYPKYSGYLDLTSGLASSVTPSGVFEAVATRLMPKSLFGDDGKISELVDAMIDGIKLSNKLLPNTTPLTQIIMTSPVNVQNGNATSAHPAWRSALWHVLMTGAWFTQQEPSKEKKLLESWLGTIKGLKDLTPGGGAYMNEASYLEPEWETTFFGSRYPELLRIKEKYDPTHFFDCYKCVGWKPSK